VDRLQTEVHKRLEGEAELIAEDAEQDMDTVFENDVLAKVDAKAIETDVNTMREYFVEEAQREVDYVANNIKNNLRSIAEEVEKEVISDKLDMKTNSDELEQAELQVKVSEVLSDVNNSEKKEFSKMEDDVSEQRREIERKVKDFLAGFLTKQKGLSNSQAENIEEEVSERLKKETNKQVKEKAEAIEHEVNQAMHIELDGLVEEDKFIIDRAKELGLVAPSSGYNTKKDVDIIENDISDVKKNFDEYMKDITSTMTKDLKSSIVGMVEKIGKEVLKEKGVKLSQTESDELQKNIYQKDV